MHAEIKRAAPAAVDASLIEEVRATDQRMVAVLEHIAKRLDAQAALFEQAAGPGGDDERALAAALTRLPEAVDSVRGALAVLPELRTRQDAQLETLDRLRARLEQAMEAAIGVGHAEPGSGALIEAFEKDASAHEKLAAESREAVRHAAAALHAAAAQFTSFATHVTGATERIGDLLHDVRTATTTREAELVALAQRTTRWIVGAFAFSTLAFLLACVLLILWRAK